MNEHDVQLSLIKAEPAGDGTVDVTFGLNPAPTTIWLGTLRGVIELHKTRIQMFRGGSDWSFRPVGGNETIVFSWPQRSALANVDVLQQRVEEANEQYNKLMAKVAEAQVPRTITAEDREAAEALENEIRRKLGGTPPPEGGG